MNSAHLEVVWDGSISVLGIDFVVLLPTKAPARLGLER